MSSVNSSLFLSVLPDLSSSNVSGITVYNVNSTGSITVVSKRSFEASTGRWFQVCSYYIITCDSVGDKLACSFTDKIVCSSVLLVQIFWVLMEKLEHSKLMRKVANALLYYIIPFYFHILYYVVFYFAVPWFPVFVYQIAQQTVTSSLKRSKIALQLQDVFFNLWHSVII